ncbi:Mth938-like domain-containing protein [Ottowia testudinis]|uniref:Mth938-like domain-containing protein n=1 Tax=Ottowia testudinis TaxID=2816950 RepID=A0A975H1M9_9BURK|nr:Mth938-like domain-containing protein [Ottowia testudinis]QTD43998.1 Mth938-like domain-containing protein [Ottowia testudinis]
MKFTPDQFGSAITGYGPGWIAVGSQRIDHSVVLRSTGEWADWQCMRFEDLTPAHFAPLVASRPELVVFGSGGTLRFPRPEWIRSLIEAGIGIETMDTGAACRTYNILAGEGRRVTAALLLAPGVPEPDRLK